MPDHPTAVTTTEPCPQCDDRRVVPRLYDSGRRYTRGSRVRAAALVPCPTCRPPEITREVDT